MIQDNVNKNEIEEVFYSLGMNRVVTKKVKNKWAVKVSCVLFSYEVEESCYTWLVRKLDSLHPKVLKHIDRIELKKFK